MENLTAKLVEIENEHPEFFEAHRKNIADYINDGIISSGIFFNSDLPNEINDKIRKIFYEMSSEKGD